MKSPAEMTSPPLEALLSEVALRDEARMWGMVATHWSFSSRYPRDERDNSLRMLFGDSNRQTRV